MAQQQRVQKPVRTSASKRADQEDQDAQTERQEVREDVRKAFFPES